MGSWWSKATLAVLAGLVAGGMALACGGDDGPSGPENPAFILVVNRTMNEVLFVRFRQCGSDTPWAQVPDRLDETEKIFPDEERQFTVEAGCYDLRAEVLVPVPGQPGGELRAFLHPDESVAEGETFAFVLIGEPDVE